MLLSRLEFVTQCMLSVCRGQMVAQDVVRGLVHMHGRRVIHLDLKSANILLARDGTAKIADVSLFFFLRQLSLLPKRYASFCKSMEPD